MMRTLLAATVLASVAALPLAASAQSDGKMRVIGRATVEVAPDFVVVHAGVSSKATSPTAALDQNSAIARKIIAFAQTFGTETGDVQTDAINLVPTNKSVREPNGNVRQEPDGYTASNTVRVRLTDLSRLGAFMRQVLDQGATNISGVRFGLSAPEKAADEARAKAAEDAGRQARILAEATKVKLGRILEVSHPVRIDYRFPDGAADLAYRPRASTVPIAVGTVSVTADVDIAWAIE